MKLCIYFSGHLLRGNRATKQNADGFNAFDTFNYPHLCDAGVNFTYHPHHILQPDYDRPMIPHVAMDPNVIVFSLFPGIQENIVRHMLENTTDNGWTENYADRETLIGSVNAFSAATAKSYNGFTAQEITQKEIVADGSTTVEVYYVRKVFTVTFKNTDGTVLGEYDVKYGVIPVYKGKTPKCPINAPVNLTFAGWTEELAPVEDNVTYVARYTAVEESGTGNIF